MVENLKTIYDIKTVEKMKGRTNKSKVNKLTKDQILKKTIRKLKIEAISLVIIGICLYTVSSITFKYALEANQTSNLTELITLVPSYISGMLIGASGFALYLKDKKKKELKDFIKEK